MVEVEQGRQKHSLIWPVVFMIMIKVKFDRKRMHLHCPLQDAKTGLSGVSGLRQPSLSLCFQLHILVRFIFTQTLLKITTWNGQKHFKKKQENVLLTFYFLSIVVGN